MAEPLPPAWPMRRVVSPCKGICIIDNKGSNLCIGCKRTIDEIGRWPMMEDAERQKIVDQLRTRKF
jgi:predicted Fe-S protein YdhL (DUF1289 family)